MGFDLILWKLECIHQGLDAIIIGPYDLSASMGLTAKFDHPGFLDIMKKIKEGSNKASVPCGVHVVTPSITVLQEKINSGYRFIAYSIDAVFLNNSVSKPII